MSDEISKNQKVGYVFNNKTIPMHNLFNRTPCFLTPHENNILRVIDKNSAVEFKNRAYTFKLYGSQLNHKTDYPLLALIIKNLVNKRQTEHKATSVRLDLSEIDELFNYDYAEKRKDNYSPIVSSLKRLSEVNIQLTIPDCECIQFLPLINSYEFHYGFGAKQPKYFQIQISELLNRLYEGIWNVYYFDFTYIDVETIVNINTENAKALIKYFMSQDYDYIDFKLDTLITLLGFQYKNNETGEGEVDVVAARGFIKKALNILMDKRYLTFYKFNKVRSWDRVRIMPKTLCDNIDISKKVIDLLPSNFNKFKSKPVVNEDKEDLKRSARLDPEVAKYPHLLIMLKEIK